MTNLDYSSSAIKDYEFIGLTFSGVHSSELGLTVVAPSGLFSEPLFAEFEDKSVEVDGRDGAYYFGTRVKTKTLELLFAFDNLTSENKKKIKMWLNPKKMSLLIFDSAPYKYYSVKVQAPPQFNFVPFEVDIAGGRAHIFKGDISVTFIAYDPYGYSQYFAVNEVPIWNGTEFVTDFYSRTNLPGWYGESGLLDVKGASDIAFNALNGYKFVNPTVDTDNTLLINGKECNLRNGGEIVSPVSLEMVIPYSSFPLGGLSIVNITNNTVFSLQHPSGLPLLQNLTIVGNCQIFCFPEKGFVYGDFNYRDGAAVKTIRVNLGAAFGGTYLYTDPGENYLQIQKSVFSSLKIKYRYIYW